MIRRRRRVPRRRPSTTVRHRSAPALLIVLALIVGACTGGEPDEVRPDGPRTTSAFTLPDGLVLTGALQTFDACDELLDHITGHALEVVTPYGLGGGGWRGMGLEVEEDDADAAAADIAPGDAPGAPVEGEDFSGTNIQEGGVDEPDRLKTDGRTMYLVNRGALEVIDVSGDEPRSLTTLSLGDAWDAQLMLHGDQLLVTASSSSIIPFAGEARSDDIAMPYPMPYPWGGGTTLTAIDVGDPSDPVVRERLTLDGWAVSSRMVEGVVRVVVRTEAGINLPWQYPQAGGLRAERAALEANREVIKASQVEDWLPYYVHQTADGGSDEGTLLACNRLARPETFSGLGVLSVLTVDLDGGSLVPGREATGILAAGDTVYASTDRLYVATTRWVDWEELSARRWDRRMQEVTTELHAFDIVDPRSADYLGSGEVPGTLLSQWAMSEHDDHLRVASTVGDPWGGGRSLSESIVTVLALGEGELAVVGQVAGLGVTETIFAVRFMGEVGYVVTFRQTDPLYTLDLRDPTDPQVVGELKIMGYSAYLHPMGDDLLLGVGQDADHLGRTKGLQLSLFDVADPAAPAVLDQVDLMDSYSDVEHDHHAFLHWPATGLTVVPFQRWFDWTDEEPTDLAPASGVLTFTAARAEGITEKALVSHVGPYLRDLGLEDVFERLDGEHPYEREDRLWQYQYETRIVRSAVIGDRLVTVSEVGVAVHDLDTLTERGWLTLQERHR